MIIMADTTGDTQVGDAINRVHKLPILQHLPPGVATASQGQEEAYAQLFGGFAVAIFAAVSLVYAVMVLLFRSFFKPVVILSALPTAIGGAFLLLLATDLSLSIPSVIGFPMLMRPGRRRTRSCSWSTRSSASGRAIRSAMPWMEARRERARPIVMTTMAMAAAGMFPTALSLGKGSEFRQPMAVAVIGGLITSTVLSLVLVPAVYALVDDVEHWLAPWLRRLVTPREAPAGAVPVPRPSKPVAAE